MTEHFIDLTDGTRLDIKVNFGTLYYLQRQKGYSQPVWTMMSGQKFDD